LSDDIGDRNGNLQIYPNPFSTRTSFSFSTPENSKVILEIANIRGVILLKLLDMELIKGSYSFTWNTLDDYGAYVNPGIYFCTLKFNDKTVAVKKCFIAN